jgi:uncharacterized ferritin-like protein (DUF455 family)
VGSEMCIRDRLASRYDAPKPKPPFNTPARRQAGFSDEELALLLA